MQMQLKQFKQQVSKDNVLMKWKKYAFELKWSIYLTVLITI